ncbi:TetR/AcrR family transcriptional regulator [Alloalcanivorax dieselolei]|nr:TetR/AcrR family transcriptional regulator [Alloalcanivorax dieselolei]
MVDDEGGQCQHPTMMTSTKVRIGLAATKLLDEGGDAAVTLRSVAERVCVSHNAPYRHFKDRNALLAWIVYRAFENLTQCFTRALSSGSTSRQALDQAIDDFIRFGLDYPNRYRLLFSAQAVVADEDLKAAAFGCFQIFIKIVSWCQDTRELPQGDPVRLSGLIYASMHGAIDLQIGGRSGERKGLGSVREVLDLLLAMLKPKP